MQLLEYGYALDSGHEFLTQNTNPSPPDLAPFQSMRSLISTEVLWSLYGPGAALTGTLRFQAWQSTATGYCPGCIIQFVVSVKDVGAVGCLNTVTGYGSYPGQSAAVPFSFSAPMTPGTYPVYSGLTLQFSCDGTVATGTEVGLVIVSHSHARIMTHDPDCPVDSEWSIPTARQHPVWVGTCSPESATAGSK